MKPNLSTTIILSALIIFSVGCTKTTVVEEPLAFTEYSYTSFTPTSTIIRPTDLELTSLTPGAIAVSQDTLFIADNTANAINVIAYDMVSKQKVATITNWTINNTSDKFSEPIHHLSVSDGKLWVSGQSSRVDVFDIKTLNFVTTIGVGVWWGDSRYNIVHAFASIVKDSIVYVRDKSALVMFQLNDVTAANYKRVPIFAKSKALGYNSQNQYHDIKLASDSSTLILTDRNDRKLYFADTKKVSNQMDLDIIDPSQTINLPGIPASLEVFSDAYLVSFQDGKFMRYDFLTKQFLEMNERLLQGNTPRAITRNNNTVWVLTNNGLIYQVDVETKTIKEYRN